MASTVKASSGTLKEFFELLWINFVVQCKSLKEFIRVVFRYYSNIDFCKIDLLLLLTYLFNSPFIISKKFLKNTGQSDIYAYGETPLTTFDFILTNCQVQENDVLFELGCGRGRTCFWANAFKKCRVIGIDYIPEFISKANDLKNGFQVKNIEFRKQDFLQADFTNATIIYLYGTSLDEYSIKKLLSKFHSLPSGTKIITISYALSEYSTSTNYEVMKRFTAQFPWGEADVYLQIKK